MNSNSNKPVAIVIIIKLFKKPLPTPSLKNKYISVAKTMNIAVINLVKISNPKNKPIINNNKVILFDFS